MSEFNDIQHKDGIWWHEAPLPGWFHRCKPQTSSLSDLGQIDRCACGAIRRDWGVWFERNQRRRHGERKKRT